MFAQLRLGPSVQYNPFARVSGDDRYEAANTRSVAGQLLLGWGGETFTAGGVGLAYRRLDYEVLDTETQEFFSLTDSRVSLVGAGFIGAGSESLPGLYLRFQVGAAVPLRRRIIPEETERFGQAALILEAGFGLGHRWLLGENTEFFVEAMLGGDAKHLRFEGNNPPPGGENRFTGQVIYGGLQLGIRL